MILKAKPTFSVTGNPMELSTMRYEQLSSTFSNSGNM